MTLRQRERRENATAGFAHPKPTPVEKKPRGLHPGGPIERRARRHIARNVQHAGFLMWLHEQRCCETGRKGSKWDPIGANHVNHERGGVGMTAPDDHVFALLRSVHRQWTDGSGRFDGWTKGDRREYAELHLEATRNRWLALPEEVRTAYQAAALEDREAMRRQWREDRKRQPRRCTKPNCTKHPHGVVK